MNDFCSYAVLSLVVIHSLLSPFMIDFVVIHCCLLLLTGVSPWIYCRSRSKQLKCNTVLEQWPSVYRLCCNVQVLKSSMRLGDGPPPSQPVAGGLASMGPLPTIPKDITKPAPVRAAAVVPPAATYTPQKPVVSECCRHSREKAKSTFFMLECVQLRVLRLKKVLFSFCPLFQGSSNVYRHLFTHWRPGESRPPLIEGAEEIDLLSKGKKTLLRSVKSWWK